MPFFFGGGGGGAPGLATTMGFNPARPSICAYGVEPSTTLRGDGAAAGATVTGVVKGAPGSI